MKSKPRPTKAAGSSKIRVLVIDDHALVRRGLVAMLSTEKDIAVVDMTDNANALKAMQAHKPDVAIVDITLRGSAGLEVIRQIAYDPRTKVLALDLHSETTYATRAIKSGAKGYLTRDADTQLAQAVRRVHAGQLAVSDDIAQQMVATLTQTHAGNTGEDPIRSLSDRELELAEHIGRGHSTSQIAKDLEISIKTVETHKAHIKKKLGIAKGSQLTRYCVAWFEQRNTSRT